MNIKVLGCGPSGLLVAHAARLSGHRPLIFSRKQKALMPGAIYAHREIPELQARRSFINYAKIGSREGYAQKVYGSPNAPCSWDKFREGAQPAWSMRDMYHQLWSDFGHDIVDMELSASALKRLSDGDLIVSTIPLPALCEDPEHHQFHSKPIWVRREHRDVCEQLGDPSIVYNGDPHFGYYRSSLIFGEGSTEFAHQVFAGNTPVAAGMKPLSTTCDCHPDIIRAGRYGRWQRGVLVHDAFEQVMELLNG